MRCPGGVHLRTYILQRGTLAGTDVYRIVHICMSTSCRIIEQGQLLFFTLEPRYIDAKDGAARMER